MLSEEEANFNFIVIGLIQPELKPTFYHTHDEQSSNPRSTTLKMSRAQTHNLPHSRWAELKPTIYHTQDEQSSNPRSTTLKMSRAQTHDLPHSRWAELKPTIYHTQDEHSNYYIINAV
jgi:hypothetical protein